MDILKENYNYRHILQLIIEQGGLSRAQIARETNLNRSTISYVVKFFLENKIVFETEEKVLTGGRASNLIKFNYDIEKLMLIDLQKKKLKILITNYDGFVYDRFDFPISHDNGMDIEFVKQSLRLVLYKYPDIENCGVAIHGIVSTTQNIISSPFYSYEYTDVIEMFEEFNLKLYIENESNIYTNGIAINLENETVNLVNIHIKDGVGSGQILNGKLYRGDNGFAGEIGHSISVPDGLECRCGNHGCLELYCSERSLINKVAQVTGEPFNIEDVSLLIQNNDEIGKFYNDAVNKLAIKVNDIILFTAVEKLYITSDIYKEVPRFEDDILCRLRSKNCIIPKLTIIDADIELFTTGFARIILQSRFQLSSFF